MATMNNQLECTDYNISQVEGYLLYYFYEKVEAYSKLHVNVKIHSFGWLLQSIFGFRLYDLRF